jgi:Tfp pilus assembly protein PilX
MSPQQGGIALVIVLILLSILTMLALAGAATATAELAMAGHEQYRKLASEAASSGIEQAMVRIRTMAVPVSTPATIATDHTTTTSRYVGDEQLLPNSSAGKLVGHHYSIESIGRSERDASAIQLQGALSIVPAGTLHTYGQIGSGLGGSGP